MKKRKTAFVLSGGGSRGAYESGAWQAISELGIKIDIVVGVSVGAINGAMVVQGDVVKTNNLWRQMETDMIFDVSSEAKIQDYAKEFMVNRGAGSTGLQTMLKKYVDEDAVRNSYVDFGLLTVEFPKMTPHYLWKEDIPYGRLHDYIIASASAFPAVHTYTIDGKYYIDGGYENNLPVPMAWERGATDVIAVYLDAVGKFYPEQVEGIENLTLIRSKWNLGDFLVFDKSNTKRILRLGYLDAMKAFDVYDGSYFTFVKDSFDKRALKQADMTAKIFDLDPIILYRHDSFLEALKEALIKAKEDMALDLDMSLSSLISLESLGKVKDILKVANKKTATIFIAENLKSKGAKSMFLSRYAMKILSEEVYAARFLIKFNLI